MSYDLLHFKRGSQPSCSSCSQRALRAGPEQLTTTLRATLNGSYLRAGLVFGSEWELYEGLSLALNGSYMRAGLVFGSEWELYEGLSLALNGSYMRGCLWL